MRDTIIGIYAILVLAAAGNALPGSHPGARELAGAREAGPRAVPLRAQADSRKTPGPQSATRLDPSEWSARPVTARHSPIRAAGFFIEHPWSNKFFLLVLVAAGICAALEIVTRFRQRSTDSAGPLILFPPQHMNRRVAPVVRPTGPGSAPAGSTAPPDSSAPRDLVSVLAPPEHTLLLLPGRFEIVNGNDRIKEIRFVKVPGTDVVTFGRQPGENHTHVRVDSPTVSRMHASMRYAESRWLIRNLSATNPVVLNGEQLAVGSSEQELHDGDRVEMGEVTFRFRSP